MNLLFSYILCNFSEVIISCLWFLKRYFIFEDISYFKTYKNEWTVYTTPIYTLCKFIWSDKYSILRFFYVKGRLRFLIDFENNLVSTKYNVLVGSEGNRLYSIYIFLKLIYPCFKLPVRLLTLTCKVNIPLSSALVGLKMNPDLAILHCIPLDQWKHELDNISSAATLIPPERNNKRIRSFCFNCYKLK